MIAAPNGSRPPPPDANRPQLVLGNYRLEERLGAGGMAEVWGAAHVTRGTPVAVKVITAERARDPQLAAALRNEVRAMARLDHEGVAVVLDFGQVDTRASAASDGLFVAQSPYVVMERLETSPPFVDPECPTWPEVRALLLHLLRALGHAHARGVIHRDIKPANVLYRAGIPKLCDFGLAHATDPGAWPDPYTGLAVGTPTFMAPEQFTGDWRQLGPWTDLYAIGCLAFKWVTGEPPFAASGDLRVMRAAHSFASVPAMLARAPFPEAFESWVRRLLEKSPHARFRRAADAAHALSALEETTTSRTVVMRRDPVQTPANASEAQTQTAAPASKSQAISSVYALAPWPARWTEPNAQAHPEAALRGLGLFGMRPIPFVGRAAERSALWSAIAETRAEGSCRVVVIEGPAGCGKSRLAEWAAESADELGDAIVLQATHDALAGAHTGIARMLAKHLRCDGLALAQAQAQLELAFGPDNLADAEERLALAAHLGAERGAEEEPHPRTFAPSERAALVTRALRALARERPLVVWLDDVQWGLGTLEYVASALQADAREPLPVTFILTAQSEALVERPAEETMLRALASDPRARRVALEPLLASEWHELVEQLLLLSTDVAHRLEERAAGNPLFAVQLVGSWVSRGLLEPWGPRFRLREGATVDLPDDVHAVWKSALERVLTGLDPRVVQGLELAAVLGHEVDTSEWIAACEIAGATPDLALVETLVAHRLARAHDPRVQWSLVHGMLRETITRAAADAGRLSELHVACVAMLRARPKTRGMTERIARHLVEQGAYEEALSPLLLAARERFAEVAVRTAEALLLEREALLARIALPQDDARWGEGWAELAIVTNRQGRILDSRAWSERAHEAAVRYGWDAVRAHVLFALVSADAHEYKWQDALARLASATDAADRAGNVFLRARCHLQRSSTLLHLGDRRGAVEAAACAAVDFEALGDYTGVANCAQMRVWAAEVEGRWHEIPPLIDEMERWFAKAGSRWGIALTENRRGELARHTGDLERAEACYRRSLAQLRALELGDADVVQLNLFVIAILRGRAADIVEEVVAYRDTMDERGRHTLARFSEAILLSAHASRAQWPDAMVLTESLRGFLRKANIHNGDLALLIEKAAESCRETNPPLALDMFELAREQWRGVGHEDDARRADEAATRLRDELGRSDR